MKITVVLPNIRSSWNVGSIFRTCDALGFEIILAGYTTRPIGQSLKLIQKTAIGAEKTVNWQYFEHPSEVLRVFPGTNSRRHLGIEINENSQSLYEYLQKEFGENLENDQKNCQNLNLENSENSQSLVSNNLFSKSQKCQKNNMENLEKIDNLENLNSKNSTDSKNFLDFGSKTENTESFKTGNSNAQKTSQKQKIIAKIENNDNNLINSGLTDLKLTENSQDLKNPQNLQTNSDFDNSKNSQNSNSKILHSDLQMSQNFKRINQEDFKIDLKNNEENQRGKKVEKEYFLWFGNEITGLENQILTELDAVLHLPMKGQKESLNIASCLCACGYLFDFANNNRCFALNISKN